MKTSFVSSHGNKIPGMFQDKPQRLEAAADYLRSFECV